MKTQIFCVLALSFVSMMAIADEAPNKPTGRQISFEEFKARCANPDQFDVQRAPQNIRVQCAEQHREFVAAPAGEFPLPNERKISTAVLADKFFVSMEEKTVPLVAAHGSCLKFKETQQSLTIERTLNCEEILAIKNGLDEFCIPALDAAKAENPRLIQVQETGKIMDTCSK